MKAETVTERTDPEGVPGALRAAGGDGVTEPGTLRETPDETPADPAGATEADTDADAKEAGAGPAADAAPAGRERPAATRRTDGDGPSEQTPEWPDRDGDDHDDADADGHAANTASAQSDGTATEGGPADGEPARTRRPAPSWAGTGTKAAAPAPQDGDGTTEPESGGGSASDDSASTPATATEDDHEDREPAGPTPDRPLNPAPKAAPARAGDGGEEPEAEAATASDVPADERPTGPGPAGSRNDTATSVPQGDGPAGPRSQAGETAAGAPDGAKGTSAAPARPEPGDGDGDGDSESADRLSTPADGTEEASDRPARDGSGAEDAAPATARDAGPETPEGGKPATAGGTRKPDAKATATATATAPKAHAPARRAEADAESDAERTSQFVALKELGAAAGSGSGAVAAPAPAPKAPEPPRPQQPAGPEVTREAPLPPLDLLAELTNTAPPPETPRRTLTRRVKVWTPIVLLLGGAVIGAQLLRPLPAPRLAGGDSSHTLEGNTTIPWPAKGQGAVRVPGSGDIATFGEQKPVPTASVAKVMTAYVILKGHPLRKNDPGPLIEVDATAVADGNAEHESRIEGLTAGTKFSQLDMLKMLMIPSANNIARLLARWDTGSSTPDAFVAKMNTAAKELGMNDTTYTDPSGLDARTVSTAADQLKLADAVMKEEAFRAVVALSQENIKGLTKPLINNNGSLLLTSGLSIKGIKTGSSTPAGGTLMWAAYKTVGEQTPLILGTLMDQHADGPDVDGADSLVLVKENSRKVIEAVRAALAEAPAVRKGQLVGYVDDGLGGRTPLVAAKDLSVIGVPGQQLRLSLGAGDKSLPHGAKAGTEVGVLTVGDGDGARTVPVAVGKDLVEPSFGARVTRLS
ncbi:serine hydrolase [Streptomyces sp. AB3(2024)]|uniref:serine hydrolase n=1 Tax=Streptomyces sp. AB3(2024) TaxID=3317321 RepID=UPI0035A2D9E7